MPNGCSVGHTLKRFSKDVKVSCIEGERPLHQVSLRWANMAMTRVYHSQLRRVIRNALSLRKGLAQCYAMCKYAHEREWYKEHKHFSSWYTWIVGAVSDDHGYHWVDDRVNIAKYKAYVRELSERKKDSNASLWTKRSHCRKQSRWNLQWKNTQNSQRLYKRTLITKWTLVTKRRSEKTGLYGRSGASRECTHSNQRNLPKKWKYFTLSNKKIAESTEDPCIGELE